MLFTRNPIFKLIHNKGITSAKSMGFKVEQTGMNSSLATYCDNSLAQFIHL